MGIFSRTFQPSLWKETFLIRIFGATKIPLLYACLPKVTELSDDACAVEIALSRRTRNHLDSMYFGALCVGADCAGGLMAYRLIERSGKKVSLVFKDFEAKFLRRPTGDVEFRCAQGPEIRAFVERVLAGTERQEMTVRVTARVPRPRNPDENPNDPVAEMKLTLSLKPAKSDS